MDSAPLGKILNEENEIDEEFIKFRKEISSKLGRNEIHQGEIRFWESIKLRKKEKAIKLEKTSTKRERKRERSECKNFHQVVREYWFVKRHKGHEIPWKIIQVEKDEQKWRFIKSKI